MADLKCFNLIPLLQTRSLIKNTNIIKDKNKNEEIVATINAMTRRR